MQVSNFNIQNSKLEIDFHLYCGANAYLAGYVELVDVLLHIWQTHTGTEAHIAYLGAGGGVALLHCQRNVGYAGAFVGHNHLDLVRLDVDQHLAAVGVGNGVDLAKRAVIARITAYDKSDAVNQFTYNGVPMWLDKDTRNGLIARLNAETAVGKQTSTLWLGTQSFTITPAAGLQMLAALEVYASECYDKTAEHKAAVAALNDEAAILNYDYEEGYPAQLNFGESQE